MLLELKQKNPDVLHIRHMNENILRFSIRKFAMITGLKCNENANDFTYSDLTPSRLIQKYFPDAYHGINKGRLVQRFLLENWDTVQDAVQMTIMYFIHTFMFFQTIETSIPTDHFRIVEDERYVNFPWEKRHLIN